MKINVFGRKLSRSELLCSARQLLQNCRHCGHLTDSSPRTVIVASRSPVIVPLQSGTSIGNSLCPFLIARGYCRSQFSQTRRNISGLTVASNKIMARSYEDAVNTLNTLQSNASVIEKMKEEREKHRHQSIPEMTQMIQRVGLTVEDIDNLSVIHVSGTKGKGSTCAYCDSILRAHGLKTGFYSSPHLVEVRERMRINGRSLSREAFTHYFWECYDRLNNTKDEYGGIMPAYFRFLTVMAYYVFKHEKVDAAVVEVGIGGEYDCTNVVRNPVVCGVASLGIDHTTLLGETIDKIAWHKAGIFKPGVPAVTVPQPEGAIKVLYDRAKEKNCALHVAPPLNEYKHNNDVKLCLGIPGAQQSINASLALQLCKIWLDSKSRGHSLTNGDISEKSLRTTEHGEAFSLSHTMAAGLQNCVWPGRCQKITRPALTYYLDGAHTSESMEACAAWFLEESAAEAKQVGGKIKRVLLFNMTGDRHAHSLLTFLLKCNFDYAVFCTNVQSTEAHNPDATNRTVSYESQLKRCIENRRVWLDLHQKSAALSNGPAGDSVPWTEPSAAENIVKPTAHENQQAIGQLDKSIINENQLNLHQLNKSITYANQRAIDQIDISITGDNNLTNSQSGNKLGNQSGSTLIFETILEGLHYAAGGRDVNVVKMMEEVTRNRTGEGLGNSMEADHIQVLCTGSLILVGNILGLIDPEVCDRVVGHEH